MSDSFKERMLSVKISEIMSKDFVTVRENDDLSVAQQKFTSYSVSHLIVVDSMSRITGILSQKYLYKTHSPRKILEQSELNRNMILDGDSYYDKDSLNSYILRNVMKKNPFVMGPDEAMVNAIVEMSRQNLGCIPIIRKDRTVTGILTNHEVVKFIAYVIAQ